MEMANTSGLMEITTKASFQMVFVMDKDTSKMQIPKMFSKDSSKTINSVVSDS